MLTHFLGDVKMMATANAEQYPEHNENAKNVRTRQGGNVCNTMFG